MLDAEQRTQTVLLLEREDLFTGTGHSLTTTFYGYDQNGKISETITEFNYSDKTNETGIAMRQTTRDAFGIIVKEEMFGEDDRLVPMPRPVAYEKDETGLVRRVIEIDKDEITFQMFGTIRYITYDHHHPYRRGLVSRIRYLTPEGDFDYENRYEYDDHGAKIRIYGQSAPDAPLSLFSLRSYVYDQRGNPVRCQKSDEEYSIRNTYDERGLLQQALVWEKDRKTGKWGLAYRHQYYYEKFEVVIPEGPPLPK